MDEIDVKTHMRRTQGRSAQGDRVNRKVSAQKGPNVTMLCSFHYHLEEDQTRDHKTSSNSKIRRLLQYLGL